MAIEKTWSNEGQQIIRGRQYIVDESGTIAVQKDDGTKLADLSKDGFTFSETSGLRRIRIGAHPTDGHVIEAISDPGIDVINELSS